MIQPRRGGYVWLLLAAWTCCGVVSMDAAARAADPSTTKAEPRQWLVYVGTYTKKDAPGIFGFSLDTQTGELTPLGEFDAGANPTFLAVHPSGNYLYAVNETGNARQNVAGQVSAFAVNRQSGQLTPLNNASAVGAGPCHIVMDAAGKHVLLANYGGGSVAALNVHGDGKLGNKTAFIQHQGSSVNPQRQKEPHAHSINLDRANKFAFAADLGIDKVLIYRFDEKTGNLTPHEPAAASVAPGAGPRHFAFHPSGKYAYVINELNSTVTVFQYDAQQGRLTELQTLSTLPEGFAGNNSTAEVQVHPSGKFLYGSNRGHDSLAIFSIADDGRLTPQGHQPTGGKTPRNFGIDPTGKYLLAANQGTNNLFVFRIDGQTGGLKQVGQEVQIPSPVCVKFIARE